MDGYVRFWIEHDTEFAMLVAQDFRKAMNERDALRAENERLRAFLQEIEDVAPEFTGVPDIARRALKRS